MANCNRQQLNITCGTDVVLHDRLIFDGDTFDPNLSVGIAANLVSSLGKRTTLDVQVVDDELLISVPWIDGTLPGCYGLEVTGSCNSKKWATYADSLIKYTKATRIGVSEVTVESDSYDITQEVGYCYTDTPVSFAEVTVDEGYGTPSVDVEYEQRELRMDFHNLKGNGIANVEQTTTSTEDGGVNETTITMDNGGTTVMQVRNGRTGGTGPKGDAGDSAIFDPSTGNISTMKQTTGDDKLSPMSQKAVTDEIMRISEFSIRTIGKSEMVYNAYRIASGKWQPGMDTQAKGYYINVVKYRGHKIVITPQDETNISVAFVRNIGVNSQEGAEGDYALVDGTVASPGTSVQYADGYSDLIGSNEETNYAPIEVIIPNNCNYLWCTWSYKGADRRPETIAIYESKSLQYVADILREEADARIEQTTGESTTQVMSQKATTDAINEISYGKLKEMDTSTIKSNAGRIYNGNWYKPQSSGSKSNGYIMPIDDYHGCKVSFTPKDEVVADDVSMRIAFTKNPYVALTPVEFSEDYPSVITSKEEVAFDVPDDANYLWFGVLISSHDCRPQKIEFFGERNAEDIVRLEDRVMVLEMKENSPNVISQAKFSEANVSLLHFSDIHADALAMEAIRDWADEKSKYIDDILNTGDTVLAYYGDDAWTNIKKYGLDQALFAVGNHDRRTTSGYKTVPVADAYATYFDNVEAWGVTQPEGAAENYLMYYYKDYAAGVRLIVLDGEAQDAGQVQWLEATLADALANNLTVVIAAHYIPGCYSEDYIIHTPCGRSTFHRLGSDRLDTINSTFKMGAAYPQAVQDFIDAGGKFAIWLAGHYHVDYLAYAWKGWGRDMSTDSGGNYYISGGEKIYLGKSDILFAAINKAGMHNADSSADRSVIRPCANFVTIQPANNVVKIIRVGINIDKYLRPINVITYDYVKKEIITNY